MALPSSVNIENLLFIEPFLYNLVSVQPTGLRNHVVPALQRTKRNIS
jgi:hypothetical protein